MKCHFCSEDGRHYVGGGMWVCFAHWLKLWFRSILFATIIGCGGAPFSALEAAPPRDGGGASVVDVEVDAAVEFDSAPVKDASAVRDAGAVDAAASDAADAQPACASRPVITKVCGSTGMTFDYPTSICVEVCDHTGCAYQIQKTPAACASWCTFICACLQTDAGAVCPGSTESCVQASDGTAFISCP